MRHLYISLLLLSVCFANSSQDIRADVTAVSVNGNNFSVTLRSNETGCTQYANWWEILNKSGKLIYRRILFHSHPDEQPFTRSGGPVHVTPDEIVYVRVHMNNVGYIGDIFKGSIKNGFKKADKTPAFSKSIEVQKPLPGKCRF